MGNTVAQDNAINHSGSDLLISAAAGSGKTRTLVSRVMKHILEGKDIRRMLIVTFTRASAAELRVRISSRIGELIKEQPDNTHLPAQLLAAGSADICTIHSFCMKIIRPNFDKLGIDMGFRLGDESEMTILKKQAMDKVIDDFYEAEVEDKDFITVCDCFGSITSDDGLSDSLLELYKKLSSTEKSIELLLHSSDYNGGFFDNPYGAYILAHLRRVTEYYCRMYQIIIEEASSYESSRESYYQTLCDEYDSLRSVSDALAAPDYATVKRRLHKISFERLKNVKGDCPVDKALIKSVRDGYKDAITDIRESFFLADEDSVKSAFFTNSVLCKAIYRVLRAFEMELENIKRAHSVCDFDDLERYAYRLLYNSDGSLTQIAEELGSQYDDIYVDEYQDTNYLQDKIFSAIARDNRFLVGDIKQSIYRFRSAEPRIFSDYLKAFTPFGEKRENGGGVSLFMSENFRSDEGVIELSNMVSDYMFKNSSGIPYNDSDRLICAKRAEDRLCEHSEICLIEKSPIKEQNAEAEYVAERIKRLLDEKREKADGTEICPSDIAILLRSGTTRQDYIDALKRRGVYSEYRTDELFFEKSEVLLAVSILNVIDNPARDIYLAGALRSDIFGISLEELIKIRQHSCTSQSLFASCMAYDKDDAIRRKLDVFFEKIEKYREECRKLSSHKVLSMVYADTGMLNGCSLGEKRSLLKLYDIARGYERGSYKGLNSFIRYVSELSKEKMPEEVAERVGESVKIMTMHSSKGLEFEYCFISGTSSIFSSKDRTPDLLFDRELGVAGYISRSGGFTKYNNVLRKCTSLAIKHRNIEEEMRVLYVALTRGRTKTVVTATVSDPDEYFNKARVLRDYASECINLRTTSHISWIINAYDVSSSLVDLLKVYYDGTEKKDTDEKESYVDENEVKRVKNLLSERFDYVYPYEHLDKLPSKLSVSALTPTLLDGGDNEEVRQNISLDVMPGFITGNAEITGAMRGTATHLFMQFCDFDNLVSTGAAEELMRLCSEHYISDSIRDLVALSHIERFISSELFSAMRSAKWIKREFRFNIMLPASDFSEDERLKGERVLVQGVTDCIMEDENGEIILIDYKTDSVTEKNYRQLLLQRHSDQLKYYKRACELMLERKVDRVLIYSVPLARTVEVEFKEEK